MSKGPVMLALGFGVLVLVVAVLLPTAFDVPNSDYSRTLELANGSTETLNSDIEAEVTKIDAANDTANITVTDLTTRESAEVNLSPGGNATVAIAGENVRIAVETMVSDSVTFTVEWPRTYGWDGSAALFADNLTLFFVLLTFVIFGGFLKAAIP